MRNGLRAALAVAVVLMAASAAAVPITYTFTGTATGYFINNTVRTDFTSSPFTIVIVDDTDNVFAAGGSVFRLVTNPNTATIAIPPFPTATLSNNQRLYDDQPASDLFLADQVAGEEFRLHDTGFAAYALERTFGPITNTPPFSQSYNGIATSEGALTMTIATMTFTAQVEEAIPAAGVAGLITLALLVGGGGVFLSRRFLA